MSTARAAAALGTAGLVPFWGLAALAHLAPGIGLAYVALRAELTWGAVILAFMAGARWAMVLAAGGGALRQAGFALLALPALAAPFLPPLSGLALLAAAFAGLLAAERTATARTEAPAWYPRLRLWLTAGAIAALALAALAV
ncbi:DUF3429 family protein [Jhaorihella thermophila]|uniref:DUF3429 domain-containing protein n=1 Tax=Jhaorihella thermophila TaxID=488547 RepID=A0A1H5Z116_9RHOB|nr:DUF3429 family protein [Jhaorihella thermophila]SEG29740.1 Protein of unknown function [Jhaorihella thermophila]